MAIIFVSSRQKQRALFWSISLLIVFVLVVVFLAAFPFQIKNRSSIGVTGSMSPDVKINFEILDSSKVENLEPFGIIDSPINNLGRNDPFSPY